MNNIEWSTVWASADVASRKAYLLMYGAPDADHHKAAVFEEFANAARALGYTLTPIVTPSPDSGRAKEIGGELHQNYGA